LTGGGVGTLPVVESIAMARRTDGRMVAAVLAKLVGWKATTVVVETNRAAATDNFILAKTSCRPPDKLLAEKKKLCGG
jgi:hypothetical protein